MPGAADAVVDHEGWGVLTRTMFLSVAGVEVVALLLGRWGKERYALVASGILGLGGLFCLYEASSYGGRLVYSYAGGVGIRTGDPADVGRLLLAGLYNQILVDRKAGRPADAVRLAEEAVRRFPGDPGVQIMAAESKLLDGHDAAAAMDMLGRLVVPSANRRLRLQQGLLLADALEAAGQKEGARATLQSLLADFPNSERLKKRLQAP
jgi:predicted Zn-dependent protease